MPIIGTKIREIKRTIKAGIKKFLIIGNLIEEIKNIIKIDNTANIKCFEKKKIIILI